MEPREIIELHNQMFPSGHDGGIGAASFLAVVLMVLLFIGGCTLMDDDGHDHSSHGSFAPCPVCGRY
jgi:hypothetical protein